MQIAIIGPGNVGTALGRGWSARGHTICFGVPNPADPKYETAARAASAAVAGNADAVANADVVVLAVPWDAVPAALSACGDLSGRIIIDATNPLRFGAEGLELAVGFSTSGAEEIAQLAPGAWVFKTMNQVGFKVMDNASGYPAPPTMFVAGDNEMQKPKVLALVRDLGFDAIDAGLLNRARLLEPYAMLWIDQVVGSSGAPDTNAFSFMHKDV